jgi:heme-degrading monooxygenase HmoA
MFARVSVYELQEGRASEALAAFSPAIERLRDLDGFVDAYFLVERDGVQGVTMTFWESLDTMERSRITAARARSAAAEEAGANVVSTHEYEVGLYSGPNRSRSDLLGARNTG